MVKQIKHRSPYNVFLCSKTLMLPPKIFSYPFKFLTKVSNYIFRRIKLKLNIVTGLCFYLEYKFVFLKTFFHFICIFLSIYSKLIIKLTSFTSLLTLLLPLLFDIWILSKVGPSLSVLSICILHCFKVGRSI